VQEKRIENRTAWETRGDLNSNPPNGPWTYTPQTILEGWLRLNPNLLLFQLFNADKKAILIKGTNNDLTLKVKNQQGRSIHFLPGAAVGEGTPPKGSIFYIHFGNAVPQASVAGIELQAANWTFTYLSDALYGSYWAATPTGEFQLKGGEDFSIKVSNLVVDTEKQQITIFFDYYNVTNINDGVYQDLLSIRQS
jgi:hypothetical protein